MTAPDDNNVGAVRTLDILCEDLAGLIQTLEDKNQPAEVRLVFPVITSPAQTLHVIAREWITDGRQLYIISAAASFVELPLILDYPFECSVRLYPDSPLGTVQLRAKE